MRSFWDLNEAYRCVQEGDSLINKMRKPELARALSALAWCVRTIPNAPELLLEVRALAGRVTDGLDKPGTDEYVDHPWRALMGQKGLTPFSYTASIKQAGVPQAPPPLPGHAPAWSYVLSSGAGAAEVVGPPVGGTGAAARRGAASASGGEEPNTQAASQKAPQQEEEEDIFSNLGTLTPPGAASGGGDGVGGGDGGGDGDGGDGGDDGDGRGHIPEGQVSDHSSRSINSLAAPPKQLAKAGVVGDDGLVDNDTNGSGVARVGGVGGAAGGADGKGKGKATSKANSTSLPTSAWRPRVCNQVWKGKQCPNRSSGCRFAHPTPCSNDRCRSGPAPGCRAFHPPMNKRKRDPPKKGNDKGSVRKGGAAPKTNGGNGTRKPNNKGRGPTSGGGSNSGSSNSHPDLQLRKRIEAMERKLELQSGKTPSYRDVAARGLLAHSNGSGGNSSNPTHGFGANQMGPGSFDRGRPDPTMLSTVVAAVMAVLSGGDQHQHPLF